MLSDEIDDLSKLKTSPKILILIQILTSIMQTISHAIYSPTKAKRGCGKSPAMLGNDFETSLIRSSKSKQFVSKQLIFDDKEHSRLKKHAGSNAIKTCEEANP
jgi:hypothetical protein